jgi:cholest-4-en-3-one 26-monooxygenase
VAVARIPEGFDFTDPDLYAERVPLAEFAELRRSAPVWWNAQRRGSAGFDDEGFWVVSRHSDVKEVSRNSDVYSTWENSAIIRLGEGTTREQIDMQRFIMINNDPPQHTALRRIVSRGFTPRAVDGLRDALAERAQQIMHTALSEGTGDFVTDVACELPLQAIAELLGVPQDDRRKIFEWSNQMIAYDDPEYEVEPETAAVELLGYSMAMAEERKRCPMDDIVTKLVQADVDGRGLNADEFGFFVLLLAVAGNETTRNAITHGMMALLDNPEQWARYKAERPATAADEIVRWATPVVAFQRTAKVDAELGGQQIKTGQRVGIFYIGRDPNPHLGFGGSGAHYCLGASLARLEIDLIFNAIAEHMPDISRAGPERRLRSGWLNGIKEFPVTYGGGR